MFSVKSSKKIFHANNIEILDNQVEKSYPYVVRSTRNNGIRGYIMENKEFLNPANTLSFAQDTFSVFYQEQAYFTGNKVKILIPKIKKFNRKIAIFMTSIYGKVLQDFTWGIGSTEDSIKDIIISLPVLPNGEIAFEYMESYIKELEAERLEELEAYLLTTGLKDYKLTEQEKAILQDFAKLQDENSKRGGAFSSLEDYLLYGGSLLDSKKQNFITHALSCLTQRALKSLDTSKWQEFRIGDLFDVISLKKLNPLDSREFRVKEMDEEHPIPAVVAKVGNNGVMYYVGKNDYEITSNKIVIIADGAVASGLVYYHEKEFTILHNAYAIELKQKEFAKKENYLFLATVIQKSIFEAFTYEFKPTWNKVKQEFISLPVLPDNNIAFEYMESFIKEIEKEHFLSLIEYYHKEMSAYNEVIETNGGGALSFKLEEYLSFYESYKTTQAHSTQLQWQEVKISDLFSVKSNPQLNKDSFVFKQNAPYPYFTRTCLNNGISGYVEYLDEEHKIKGEAIAVGMLGMQFFYMEKDFYAGQFTKSIYPKFTYPFNAKIALYFIAQLNKKQKIFQGVLVRDFEKTFYKQSVLLPIYENGGIAFEYIESFIKALQKEVIKNVNIWNEKKIAIAKEVARC